LTDVFDRGLRDGFDALPPAERELYLIQDFILDYEMNSLSGYFYNWLPELNCIRATIAAMRKRHLSELASLLTEATDLFTGYIDPDPPSTWERVLKKYDPSNRLQSLDEHIGALDDYGLGSATIA